MKVWTRRTVLRRQRLRAIKALDWRLFKAKWVSLLRDSILEDAFRDALFPSLLRGQKGPAQPSNTTKIPAP